MRLLAAAPAHQPIKLPTCLCRTVSSSAVTGGGKNQLGGRRLHICGLSWAMPDPTCTDPQGAAAAAAANVLVVPRLAECLHVR